jgi:hypothetical protein
MKPPRTASAKVMRAMSKVSTAKEGLQNTSNHTTTYFLSPRINIFIRRLWVFSIFAQLIISFETLEELKRETN